VAVRKGETIRLDDDDPGRYYLAKSVDVENYDKWDSDRVKNHDEAVSTAALNGTSNSLVYGLSDLNSYGDYFFVPGYGYMWRPAYASLAWDPFADGYWVSYPGSGYVFVSSYPWGWAPYRYGSWHFVNGRGWCWAPGKHWNSWHSVPPVQNLPPNYHHPQAPHHGPPVIAVNDGRPMLAPSRRGVLDNDALEHRWPRSEKEVDQSSQVLRQRQSQASVPSSSFASGTAVPPSSQMNTFPAPMVTGAAGRANRVNNAERRSDALLNERLERDQRNFERGRAMQVPPTTTSMGGSFPSASPSTHSSPSPMTPRMESHTSGRAAPQMRMESRPMASSPSMGSSHSASPSFSGGAMSRGSGGGGGGGGGRSGGSHH